MKAVLLTLAMKNGENDVEGDDDDNIEQRRRR